MQSKTVTTRNASQQSGFALLKLVTGFRDQRIQFSYLEICLDLLIPDAFIELENPGTKLCQILGEALPPAALFL